MKGIKISTHNLFIVAIILLCSSCGANKFLGEDDYLITKNKVILEDTEKAVKEKSIIKYELSTLIRQKPNSKFLFFFKPELRWYFKTNPEEEPKTKFGKWFRRKFTEKPVLYNKTAMDETAVSMKNYLKNRGYFDAKVFPSNQLKRRKKAHVNYKVLPGNLYTVDSLVLESKDPTLDSLKAWLSEETLMTKGAPVDISLYNQEVARITDSLRNNGYAFFYTNNVKPLETDTTGWGYGLTIYDELLKPFGSEQHRKYKIGQVNIYANFNGELGVAHKDTLINGLHYRTIDGEIGIKPKVIRRNVYLDEGDTFNQSLINDTNKQLNALGIYKFVNIRTTESEDMDGYINIDIILSKLKKQNVTLDADINNSERPLINSRFIYFGNSLNVSYLNRNTFLGAERVSVSLESGVEFNLSDPSKLINSLDFLARLDVQLPEFIDIPGTWKLLSLLKFGNFSLLNPQFLKDLKKDGIPIGSLSANSFSFRDFYRYNSINASLSYDLKRAGRQQYTIKTIGLTSFQSVAEPAFEVILDANPLLKERFKSRLFTGLLYTELNYLWTSKQNSLGETWQWRFNHELSGAEALLANQIIKGGKTPFKLPGGLEFAHFTRFELDVRYFKEFRGGSVFGVRADLGLAVPFSGLTQTVPFIKQFYVGGANSIRAWQIRELGPGEYNIGTDDRPYFQTGDFKFAFNLEYRFKFIPFFNMDAAIFLDGGNIWTLREDTDRPGSQLLWKPQVVNGVSIGDNFIDQIALGTGFGVRTDFTYFVLSLDLGLKLLSPYQLDSGSRWYTDQYRDKRIFDLFNLNLLFGYPF